MVLAQGTQAQNMKSYILVVSKILSLGRCGLRDNITSVGDIMALTNAIFFYELFSQLPFLNFIEGENQDKTRQLPRLASC